MSISAAVDAICSEGDRLNKFFKLSKIPERKSTERNEQKLKSEKPLFFPSRADDDEATVSL